jgi:hypothetical protein
MARRLFLNSEMAVISLPGYDAGPSTPEIGKSFDSRWPFAGLVLGEGYYNDPAPADAVAERTASSAPMILTVAGLRSGYTHYIALFFPAQGAVSGQVTIARGYLASPTTISIPRQRFVNLYERLLPNKPYTVFAA